MDKVVHFEIPADDQDRASSFYKKVFGWDAQSIPEMKYTILRTGPVDEKFMPKESGFISGGMMDRSFGIENPVITINVDSIDEALENLAAEGGEVVREKMEVGDMGFAAYFKDTEGNVMGLWENAKEAENNE